MAGKSTKENTKKQVVQQTEMPDKIPPQALEIEQAVLGALVLSNDAILQVMDIITAESFYSEKHQIIYRAMMEISRRLDPIDLLTLTNELRSLSKFEEIGGAAYLTLLSTKVASSANLEYHAKIVAQK